jgi:hypothetical protein
MVQPGESGVVRGGQYAQQQAVRTGAGSEQSNLQYAQQQAVHVSAGSTHRSEQYAQQQAVSRAAGSKHLSMRHILGNVDGLPDIKQCMVAPAMFMHWREPGR